MPIGSDFCIGRDVSRKSMSTVMSFSFGLKLDVISPTIFCIYSFKSTCEKESLVYRFWCISDMDLILEMLSKYISCSFSSLMVLVCMSSRLDISWRLFFTRWCTSFRSASFSSSDFLSSCSAFILSVMSLAKAVRPNISPSFVFIGLK